MAAGDEKDLIEAVVTCEGNLHDPDFQDRFRTLVDSLKTALYISKTKDPFRVRKIEPWNSVRVTISIPKEAAQKLKLLAQQGSNVLRSMGILSVQVEGDQVISLTWAAQNNEATQVILRQTNDNEPSSSSSGTSGISSSSSLPASSPSISSISSSVASISSPIPLTPGPSSSSSSSATSVGGGGGGDSLVAGLTLDMLSSSSSSQSSSSAAAAASSSAALSFHRSPNVVAPGSEPIPVLPPKPVGPTSLATSSRGPFPFVSMTHAAQAAMIQRSSGIGGVGVGVTSEISPMTMMSVINNNLNSSGSGSSNAANSTNSIVVASSSSSSSSSQQNSKTIMHPPTQQQQSNFPVTSSLNNQSGGQHHPHPPPGALVIVSSSSSSSAFSNVNSNSVGGKGSELNNLNALVSHPPSQQAAASSSSPSPHQSHQSLQHVNVPPPPYPPPPHPLGGGSGVNQSSNHLSNLSSSPLHHLHQQQQQLQLNQRHPPPSVRATLQISSDGSSSMALQQLQLQQQQHQQQQQVSTSPLLVNLLQNQQNDGSSQSPGPSSSSSSTTPTSASADPAYNQQKFLLQQQQLKKTKRGQSLDGASGGSSGTTPNSATSTDPYQFTLPSDPSSPGLSLSRPPSTTVPNSTTSSSALIHQSQGRTTIVHHPHQQQASLRTTPPQHQQVAPAPPQPSSSYPSTTTTTGESSNLTAHQNFPTSLPNGPHHHHHQNLATVTLVEHNASSSSLSSASSTSSSSSSPCAADQSSRTLLPITTSVNIVSNKSPLSNKSSSTANLVNSLKDSSADSKTFIPPLDPRLSSSQVQKIVSSFSTSSSSPQGKNSQDAAKSSTSHLQNQQGRTTALLHQQNRRLSSSKDSRGPSAFPSPSPGGGKPRQFLINPLTGHLEPMTASSSSGGGDSGGGAEGHEEIETGGKSSKGFHHSRNKVGKGLGTPQGTLQHRQIVTTETGVTVARVIKSEDNSSSSSSSIAQSSMGTDGDSSSVISVSKKSRIEDNSSSTTTAALNPQNSQKDNLKPGSPTVTATSVVSTGEKIKLRLKLEKSEPISPAYKVDVSFVKKSEKGILPGSPSQGSSSPSSSGSTAGTDQQQPVQPRVPPLHISLRGKNAAVVVSPRREETKDKEMPPPPSSVSGNTKESSSSSLVISQHPKDSLSESSKSAMSSSSSHHHHFLNSHDGSSKSTSKLEKKRAKSRVKSFDGSSTLDKSGRSGKMSRPKLSKEVSSRQSISDGKEAVHLTMPVLQPAVTLPSASSSSAILPVMSLETKGPPKNKSSSSSPPSLLPTVTTAAEVVIKSETPNLIVHKITTSNNNVNLGGAPVLQPPAKSKATTETMTKADSLKPPVLLSSSLSTSSSSSSQAVPPPATCSTSSQDLRPVEKKDEVLKSSSQSGGVGGSSVVEIRKVPPPHSPSEKPVGKIKMEVLSPSLPPPPSPVVIPSPVSTTSSVTTASTTIASTISKGGDVGGEESSPQLVKIEKDQQLPPPPPVPSKQDDTTSFKGAFSSLSTSKSSSSSSSSSPPTDIPSTPVGGGSSLTKASGAVTEESSPQPPSSSSTSIVVTPSLVTKPVNSPKNQAKNVEEIPTSSSSPSSSLSSSSCKPEDESVVSPVISLSTATTVSCDIINTTTTITSSTAKSESEQQATNTTSDKTDNSSEKNTTTTSTAALTSLTGFESDAEKNKKVEEISKEVPSSSAEATAAKSEVSCTGATSNLTTNTTMDTSTSEIKEEEKLKVGGETTKSVENLEEKEEKTKSLETETKSIEKVAETVPSMVQQEVVEPPPKELKTVTPIQLPKMDTESTQPSQDEKSETKEKAGELEAKAAKPVTMSKVIDIDNPFKALMMSGSGTCEESNPPKQATVVNASQVLQKKENQKECNTEKPVPVIAEEGTSQKLSTQTQQQQQQLPQLPVLNRIHHDSQVVQNEKDDKRKKSIEVETPSKQETQLEKKEEDGNSSQSKNAEGEVKVNEVPATIPAAVESEKPVQVEAQQTTSAETRDLPKAPNDDTKMTSVVENENVKGESKAVKAVEPAIVQKTTAPSMDNNPISQKQEQLSKVEENKTEGKKEENKLKKSDSSVPALEVKPVEEEKVEGSSTKVEEPQQKSDAALPKQEVIQNESIPSQGLEKGKVTSDQNEHKMEQQKQPSISTEVSKVVELPKKTVTTEEKSESAKDKEVLESSKQVETPKNPDSSSILPSKVSVSKEVSGVVPKVPPKNTISVENPTETKSNDTKSSTPPQQAEGPVENAQKSPVPQSPKVVKVSQPQQPPPPPVIPESKSEKSQKMENHEPPKENAVCKEGPTKSVEETGKPQENQSEKEISKQVDPKMNSEPSKQIKILPPKENQAKKEVESVKEKVISKESVMTPVQQAVVDVKLIGSESENKCDNSSTKPVEKVVLDQKEVKKTELVENVVEIPEKKDDKLEKVCKVNLESDPVQVAPPPSQSTSQTVLIKEIQENKLEEQPKQNISSVEETPSASSNEPTVVEPVKKEEPAPPSLLVTVNLPPVPKISVDDTSCKTASSSPVVDEVESYTENDVNVKVITQNTQDNQSGGMSSTSNTPPPISIVLPSSAVDGGKGAPPAKNTYKRRAEIKPGALQNTLKRLHDNFFPKVLKTSEQQDALTQSRQMAEEEAAAAEQATAVEKEKPATASPPVVTNKSPSPTPAPPQVNSTTAPQATPLPPNLRPSVSIPLPQIRQVPNIIAQRPKGSNSSAVGPPALHQIPTSSILVSTATISSATFTSVVSSTTGSPQTVFAIHPNMSIPANFAQLQHSSSHPIMLPGSHKMVPIKLVTLPKQHGAGPIQTIPLGGTTPNRSSPNLLEAVNIVANAGSRSSSPKTTLIGNTVQTTPLNLSSMSLPVGSNLHFVPISVSSGTGTTGNVKVLMTQPIKMQQGTGGMVLKSMVMGNNPTTIRVIRPANLQDSIGLQSLIKSQGHGKQENASGTTAVVVNNVEVGKHQQHQPSSKSLESSVLQISNADAAAAATAVVVGVTSAPIEKSKNATEILTIQSDSLFKKLDGVEIVDTGSPLNNDDLPFEADIIHDEKDLADVLAAEATENDEVIGNCIVDNFHHVKSASSAAAAAAAASAQMKVKEEKEKPIKKEAITTQVASQNHVGSRRFLKIDKTVDSSHFPTMMRINSPLYTYSSAGSKGKSRGLNIVTAAAPTPVSRSPSPLDTPQDLHGEDEEIINSFSKSPSQPRLSPQQNATTTSTTTTGSTSSKAGAPQPVTNCDKNSNSNSLGEELSIEIPPIDMEVNSSLSPHQTQQQEGKRCTRSTRSNPRLSPDITAFVSETTSSKPSSNKLSVGSTKGELMALRNSPKPSPTGSLKVLSPTPSSLTITPSTSTRSSPILHSQQQQQISASNAAATINAVAMGIIDKIQGNATAQNVKNARISKLSQVGNKRKRQESDSSSASRDENMEDKAEIDLNSRPGKRKCSENAAEMIKVCIGVEDSPKRNSSSTSSSSSTSGGNGGGSAGSKKTEDGGGNGNSKGKEGGGKGGKKQMNILMEEDDDADSEVSFTRERSGRSSRESSEDRSSSRGSSAQRIVAAAAAAMAAAEKLKTAKEEESSAKETVKSGRLNTRVHKGTPGKSKNLGKITNTPVKNAKDSSGGAAGKGTPTGGRRVNRVSKVNSAKSKASPLTPAKTRTNFRKDGGAAGGGGGAADKGGNLTGGVGGVGGVTEKHLTNVSGSTGSGGGGGGGGGATGQISGSTGAAPGENENAARRKTRSSAAGKRHAT